MFKQEVVVYFDHQISVSMGEHFNITFISSTISITCLEKTQTSFFFLPTLADYKISDILMNAKADKGKSLEIYFSDVFLITLSV